jgi:hypothetical protein
MTDFTGALGQFAGAGAGLTKGSGALGQYSDALGGISNAAGVVGGVDKGGVSGYGGAAVNAGSLAGKLGLLGSKTSGLNQGIAGAGNVLGIYNGINQGGVNGYGGAAVNAAQLGARAGAFGSASGAVGNAAGWAAVPLNLYNEIKGWKSGATGSDALSGAVTGAGIGQMVIPVPFLGAGIGALVGGAAGALSSVFGNGRVDPENANWNGYTGAWNQVADAGKKAGATDDQIAAAQKNLTSQVTNPYGALAGYFDLRDNQVKGNNPLYAQYGRMGEEKFTNDLVSQINAATKAGTIGPNDDASAIYSKVVQPWEDSWGKGQSTDSNSAAMQGLLTQMISQYEGGTASDNWLGAGGQKAFANLGRPPTGTPTSPTGPSIADADQLNAMAAAHDQQRGALGLAPATQQPIAAAAAPTPQATQPQVGSQIMRRPVMARGGALSQVTKKRKRFDDGGDVDYDFSSQPSFDPGSVIDFNSLYSGGSGNDNTDFLAGLNDIQGGLDQSKFTNDQLGTFLDSYEAQNAPGKPSAWDSLKKNATGGAGLSGLLKAYAPLIPLVSGAINSKNTKAPALAPGMTAGAIGSLPTGHFNRTQNMAPTNAAGGAPMTQQDWYTYGQRPEASFYSNNQIPLNQTVAGQAKGGRTPPENLKNSGALGQAIGQPEFNSAQEQYVPDQGPGDGQSDDVPARLSKGEFVFDAHTVSMLGNGSNSTGAQKLEQLRQNLRKHAAKSNSKGKQFMHAKDPEQYMRQGKAKAGAR